MFVKACSALVIALLANSAFAQDCARTYTIKAGDICDSISASQKVSTFQLAAVNSDIIDDRCGNLQPGGQLCLGRKGEDCSDVYVVKANDTCEKIAAGHNTNTTILRLNNPQINDFCDNIYIGEVLCVAGGVNVPPIPAGGVVVPVNGPPAVSNAPPAPTTTVLNTPTAPPVSRPTANAAPAAVNDDDDCDDDDDAPAPPAPAPPAPAPPAPAPPAPAPPAPAAPADDNGDDDDDLPFCDELEDDDY